MKNRQIFRALSLLAALCIAAGCNQSAAEETTTTTAAQTNSAVTVMEAAKTTATEDTEKTDPEISESIEPEIDYVDEDGIVYYKNPTFWTYEMVYETLSIENKKVEAPLTFEDFGDKYSLYEETLTYFDDSKSISAGLIYNGYKFGSVLLSDCENIHDRNNKELGFIFLQNLPEEWREDFPNITVNDIGLDSTRSEVINVLGIPYSERYQDGISNGVLIYKSQPEQMNGTVVAFLYDNKVVNFSIILNA